MKFVSTRSSGTPIAYTLTEGILQGLAPDGGLLVPVKWPTVEPNFWRQKLGTVSWPQSSIEILNTLFPDESLKENFPDILNSAFSFPLVLKDVSENTSILELFHGPTSAFKDFGARFLAKYIQTANVSSKPSVVVVATSGDTGGAVASAFSSITSIPVVILYPKGKISPRQEKQLCCWGPKVKALAVKGSFDDAQKLAKSLFNDPTYRQKYNLISANSINLGRLIPQMLYYAYSSLQHQQKHPQKLAEYIIPSGNVGNATAAFWARKLGFPIGKIVLAHNANKAVPNYYLSQSWEPLATVSTLANAMDVGNPSNMERIIHLSPGPSTWEAYSVSDAEISQTIQKKPWGEILCPHTATAAFVRLNRPSPHSIIVSTAHPAKFETIVEPLVGKSVEIPEALAAVLKLPTESKDIDVKLELLKRELDAFVS